MLSGASNDLKEYLVWLMALAVVVVGARHAKEVIAFILDKLYQIFIQDNAA